VRPHSATLRRRGLACRAVAVILLPVVAGCTLRRLDLTADRTVDVPASGVRVIVVRSGAGWLRVEGHPGYTDVRARGIAHASTQALLDRVQLNVRRTGDTLYVTGVTPMDATSIGQPAALDLTLHIPSGIALDVADESGETVIRNVGPLRIDAAGTGGVQVDGVDGAVQAKDGPGDLEISNVRGDVRIDDGSGDIYVSSVRGSVDVPRDGAGEIQAADVTGNVHVGEKSSGEVSARDIGGDLTIEATGSGSVEYHDVKGKVTVPARRR
jgi:hypothetical protein